MIVTDRVGARLDVALLHTADPEWLTQVAHTMEPNVIAYGEEIGAFIRSGSIWATAGPENRDNFTRPVFVEWCPNPEDGVEFRGGPWDGEIKRWQRERDGKPMPYIVLPPLPQEPSISDLRADVAPRPMQTYRYRRAGIDSDADRWVYVFER